MENQGWLVSDIAGCRVLDESGNFLGILQDVLPTGTNDVWIVASDAFVSGELMLPALKSVVRSVDPGRKEIVVQLPPGLKEIYEPPAP